MSAFDGDGPGEHVVIESTTGTEAGAGDLGERTREDDRIRLVLRLEQVQCTLRRRLGQFDVVGDRCECEQRFG